MSKYFDAVAFSTFTLKYCKEFDQCVNMVNMQQWKMCLCGEMLLLIAKQQRTNEDAG
jgi:hypothetical protein